MKCEICQQFEADSIVKVEFGGEKRELHVCHECLGKHGVENVATAQSAEITVELFFRSLLDSTTPQTSANTCPNCQLSYQEFRKRSWLGCPVCYDHFGKALEPMLRDMHKGYDHRGKIPRRARKVALKLRLEKELERAVAAQDFEEAARLRDSILELTQTADKPASAVGRDNAN